jgi:hypothetical protein
MRGEDLAPIGGKGQDRQTQHTRTAPASRPQRYLVWPCVLAPDLMWL